MSPQFLHPYKQLPYFRTISAFSPQKGRVREEVRAGAAAGCWKGEGVQDSAALCSPG